MAKSAFAGGQWGDRARKTAAEDRALEIVPVSNGSTSTNGASGGNAKTVEGSGGTSGAPAEPKTKQPASVVEQAVPVGTNGVKKSEESAATIDNKQTSVEQATEQGKSQGKQSLRIESKDTFVELPGLKGMTAEQIVWELNKSRDADRRVQEANDRVRSVEREPMRETQREREQRESQQPKPRELTKVERPKLREKPKFTPPKGTVDGDPEYDEARLEYQGDLTAWQIESQGLRPVIEPLLDRFEALEARLDAKEQETEQYEVNLNRNRANYTVALQELPFEMDGLDADTQQAVFDRIRDIGRDIYRVDLADGTQMRSKEHSVDTIARMVLRAFPPGSPPPGYDEVVPSAALAHVQQNGSRPLVERTQPDPLPETGPAGLAYSGAGEKEKSKGPVDFGKRVSKWMKPA